MTQNKSKHESLSEAAERAVADFGMLESRRRILIALSGGADSVALTLWLRSISQKYGLTLFALHVNHMIRGGEADRDEDFCRRLCARLDIPLEVAKIDIPRLAEAERKGLEECARDHRYRAIECAMEKFACDAAALAHNAKDNAETVIYNLSRGASLSGAGGIPPVRDKFIRPLIYATRDTIIEYCRSLGCEYVTDSTNSDTAYTRNRIRENVLPELEAINGSYCEAFTAFSAAARRDSDYLDKTAEEYTDTCDRDTLASLHDALLSRALYMKWKRTASGGQLTHRHIEEMSAAIRGDSVRISHSLPGRVIFTCLRDKIKLERFTDTPADYCFPLETGREYSLGDGSIFIAAAKKDAEDESLRKYIKGLKNIYKLFIHESVNSAKIIDNAYIRNRRDGDILRRGGFGRRVKVLFSDAKLDDAVRKTLPFLCDGGGIVWIPAFGLRDGMNKGERDLELFYFTDNELPKKQN